jgi:hypothetical protein
MKSLLTVVLVAVLSVVVAGCSFYPSGEDGVRLEEETWAEVLCDSANEWTRTCGYDEDIRPPLERGVCVERLRSVDDEILEFNAWCYARYRAYRFCEPLARTNVDSGYWQPTLSVPELGCVDEWPDEWLVGGGS